MNRYIDPAWLMLLLELLTCLGLIRNDVCRIGSTLPVNSP